MVQPQGSHRATGWYGLANIALVPSAIQNPVVPAGQGPVGRLGGHQPPGGGQVRVHAAAAIVHDVWPGAHDPAAMPG